jgi:hypothetical protein
MSTWLNDFRWDWWFTGTFRKPMKAHVAKPHFEEYLDTLDPSSYAFIALEKHYLGDGVHVHALTGNTGHLWRSGAWALWNNTYGRCRILPYVAGRGAGFYLTKYITKDRLADWDCFRMEGRRPDPEILTMVKDVFLQ